MPGPNWQPPVLAPYLRPTSPAEFSDPDQFSDPRDHDSSPGPKAKLGTDERGRDVWYDPMLPGNRLPNGHLVVTGESGSGKTQGMKNLLAELGLPALVLDFKDDYAEPQYAQKEGFSVYDPTKRPLPFNPLQPSVDPQTGVANKTFHTYQVVEIVARIYGLGELQQHALREAIKSAYAESPGIPTFDDVKVKLEATKGTGELLGHLSPIFDFGFFSDPDPTGFEQIASGNTVIRLSQLPGNEVKNSVAEFFLMALYNYLIRRPQTSTLRQVLVLDEAWRVVNSPFLEPLMRESRAFGLGVFVGTQFPTDLPETVAGNAATKLFFSQSSPNEVNEIARIITGKSMGTEAERVSTAVRGLKPLHCVLYNKQYEPYVSVAADAYFARTEETTMTELPQPSAGRNLNQSKGEDHRVEAQNSGPFPEYTCPRCQGPAYEPGQTCSQCQALTSTFEDVDAGETSLEERIENAQEPWTKSATTWDDLNDQGLAAHDYFGHGEDKRDDQCGGCQAIKSLHDQGKHKSVLPDWLNRGLTDPGVRCWWCKNDGTKTAEMQPFPPGEAEEEGPFAPFSMSEWQMVKGPKRRNAHFDEDGREDDEDYDPTPTPTMYRGTDGCTHLHHFPNVTPSSCAYCAGTE